MVSVAASMRVLYVFVAMEVGSRRILHTNVIAHPTAQWTLQKSRECLANEELYRFLIHNRDSVFSASLDPELKGFGPRVLKSPVRPPKANACCERLSGKTRRECLDYLMPFNERQLARIVRESLQSRPPTLRVRSRNPGTSPSQSFGWPAQTQASRRVRTPIDAGSMRVASRIPAGEGGHVASDRVLADHRRGAHEVLAADSGRHPKVQCMKY
jgi:hypothetical protein